MAELTEAVVLDYRPTMLRLARQWERNAADAEDLVQEACLRIWRGRRSCRMDASPQGWMWAILRNTYVERRRQGGRAPQMLALTERDCPTAPPPCLPPADVLTVLAALPPHYRATVLLRVRGYSYLEIAARLRVSVGTVRSRLSRARALVVGDISLS